MISSALVIEERRLLKINSITTLASVGGRSDRAGEHSPGLASTDLLPVTDEIVAFDAPEHVVFVGGARARVVNVDAVGIFTLPLKNLVNIG